MELSILQIILYILIPFAPLYARVVDLNGSLDHPWTMIPIFNILPFSIIPIMMMAFGIIKKGNGSKPYDYFMIIPVFFRFIISAIIGYLISNPILNMILVLLLSIISIMIPNIIRRNNNCKDIKKDEKTFNIINEKQIIRSFIDSLFELGAGELFIVIVTFIPFIGIAFKLISMIPIIGKGISDIIWSVGFICAYIFINMYNQNNIDDLCYPEKFVTYNEIIRIIFGIIFILIGSGISLAFGSKKKVLKTISKLNKLHKKIKKLK